MLNSDTTVKSFFIFNSNFGPNEGDEHKRIIFFHPNTLELEAQKMQVGLCEAVIKYMTTFSSSPCEYLHTQKTRQIFYSPEENFWMVLIVNVPFITKVGVDGVYYEYHGEEVHSEILRDRLKAAYRMFKLFAGHFSNIPKELIYKKCENFFKPYLAQNLYLTTDIKDIIQGVQYLPLDRASFFKVMCLIDLVEVDFPDVKCSAFLYNDRLIWNSLVPDDMLTLNRYLVDTLLPEHVERELQGGAVVTAQRHGRYISPPESFRTEDDLKRVSKVHFTCENDSSKVEVHHLVVYRALSTTVCFSIPDDKPLSLSTVRGLDSFIGPQLATIASSIGEYCGSTPTGSSCGTDAKFIYFNRLNLALKTSVSTNKLVSSTMVKPDVLNLLADMHCDNSLGKYGEIIIKTFDDYWITGKRANEREFYVIIHQKNANLKEISDEVKKICDSQMKGIFFYPV